MKESFEKKLNLNCSEFSTHTSQGKQNASHKAQKKINLLLLLLELLG